jgi:vancomycin permeability regulator SanA
MSGLLRKTLRGCALGALFGAGLFAFASLGILETNAWVAGTVRGKWSDEAWTLAPRDFAIVPGVRFRDGQPVSGLEQRLEMALSLFRTGRTRRILVSGDEERAGHEATGMRAWLVDRGVPPARILVDPLGVRTLATMTRASHVYGVRNAIVCTQRIHVARTLFLAEGSGIDAVAYVPPSRPTPMGPGERHESWKTTLAFIERYLLGQTSTSSPSKVPAQVAQLVIKAALY